MWPKEGKGCHRHGSRRGARIALTFDDGPNEPATSRILEILRSYSITATFFEVGANVESFPETAQRVAEAGHDIGNHSYQHSPLLVLRRTRAIVGEIERAQGVIFETTGVNPAFFRPPHGIRSPWLVKAVRHVGLELVLWDSMTNDWNPSKSAAQIAADILRKTRAGSVIVLHDGRDRRHGFDRTQLLYALPQIIEGLKARGFDFVPLSQLLVTEHLRASDS